MQQGGERTLMAQVPVSESAWTDRDVIAGESYYYYLRAYSSQYDMLSDWSAVQQFTTTHTGISGYSLNARVVPNPATDHCTVECAATSGTITLYDVCGQQVLSTPIAGESTVLNLSSLSEGIYMLHITADDHSTSTIKIIKK